MQGDIAYTVGIVLGMVVWIIPLLGGLCSDAKAFSQTALAHIQSWSHGVFCGWALRLWRDH